ncbi:MAG TPA: M20 family metallopeptidase, partial [Vicinamibacteria bacterium]|nr:M20 family metallopeptidase [Vicinamibacteria bacterium]
ESRGPGLVGDLEELVGLESPSDDAVRVGRMAAWIRDRLRERGVPAELRPCPPRGDALLASVASRERGTLLLGHLDTVWPVGTLAERPWRLEEGKAYGPGVFDMKAGIVVGMAVVAALARQSPHHPVSLLLVPDEEVGSAASRELTVSLARRHRRVLVLEPSQDGAAKVARKGCGTFRLRFSGRAAHAGLAPEKGASALAEMARFVLFLDRVANPAKGTTLTATVARAGTATNVVPETAELAVDGRAWSREEVERATAAIRGYGPADPGVTVSVEGGFERPPLEPSGASTALYEAARRLAAEIGLELGAARVGGGSDGNFTAAAGIPTLDGLGPRGDGAHARDEHVVVDDLPLRAALVAALVCEA